MWHITKTYVEIPVNSALLTVCFSPDANLILVGALDNSLKIFDTRGNLTMQMNGHSGRILCATFSPDGEYVVSGSKDGVVLLWDLKGNIIHEFRGHKDAVMSVDFSADGKSILTGSLDRTARIWKVPQPLDQFLKSDKIEPLSVEQRQQFGFK